MNSDSRDYTRPKRKNRLDYSFLSVDLQREHLDKVYHVRDRKWHTKDHIPVEFSPSCKKYTVWPAASLALLNLTSE